MSYDYTTERPSLFTEQGVEMVAKLAAFIEKDDRKTITVGEIMEQLDHGPTWTMLAAVDYMIEKGRLVWVKLVDPVPAQHQILRYR